MIPSEVVRMSSCETVNRDDSGRAFARIRYRAPGKSDFVFLCLGTVDQSEDFSADEKVRALLLTLGWRLERAVPKVP